MTIELRAVQLQVETSSGAAGFSRRFDSRLVVVRGSNTVGKSLLLQSLLYGLGLEGLFATRKGVLTRAMTTQIDLEAPEEVVSSWVEVVVANASGDMLTIRRVVRPESGVIQETDRVRAWHGNVFGLEDRPDSEDYLVGRPGVARLERGFHRFLAEFLGWSLPAVPTYDQRYVPLYLQVIFGLAYVDQKRGWGGIVPQVPTTYQIIEPLRRAVEFTLDLEVLRAAQRRQALAEREKLLRNQEERLRGRLEAVTRLHGGRSVFPNIQSGESAALLPSAEVLGGEGWVAVDERIGQLQQARAVRARGAITEAEPARSDLAVSRAELSEAEAELGAVGGRLEALNSDEQLLHMQLGALGRRLSVLDDEYQRYGQLEALQQLGSVIAPRSIEDGDCPTCHQSLEAVESIEGNALPLEETREALKQDRLTVKSLLAEAEQRVAAIDVHRTAWTEQMSALRLRIRALKNDLVAADGTPSSYAIQHAIEQEQELARLTTLQAQFLEDAEEWTSVASSLVSVASELKALGPVALSSGDEARVETWISNLQSQLVEYGFESAIPSEIEIDPAMKPVVDGYDIGFQGSASDGIRLRWSYLLSLMETCSSLSSPHPGVLLIDEPGQQGVEEAALASLYRHAGSTSLTAGQIFLTTSEPLSKLQQWMGNDGYELVDLGTTRLLQRL